LATPRVLVVGPAYLDVLAAPLAQWPRLGEEVQTQRIELAAGGFAISAIALRRLGVDVSLGTAIGADGPGRYLAALLAADGVERVGPAVETTAVTIAINHQGDRAFVTAGPPSGESLLAAGLAALRETEAVWLHLSGRGPWSAEVARAAHAQGLFVSLDCGTDRDWLGSPDFREVLRQVDIYLPNAYEASCVTGLDDPESAARALGRLVPQAIVKLGADGVLRVHGTEVHRQRTARRDVLDATGAGDVFDAGYIAGRLFGFSADEATALGQHAAGEALAALGGATAAPRRASCEAALPHLPWPAL
jgi:sugar/nucleoside kinase (ribokinase family)